MMIYKNPKYRRLYFYYLDIFDYDIFKVTCFDRLKVWYILVLIDYRLLKNTAMNGVQSSTVN